MKDCANTLSEDLRLYSPGEREVVTVPGVKIDGQEKLNGQGPALPVQDGTLICSEISICQEFSQSLSLDAKGCKNLSKCKTFPASKGTQAHSSFIDSIGGQRQDPSASGASAYSRSISLPSSSSLVSAMKGGRVLNGSMVKTDLRVKWAPEVYDPPSSSMSHTVRSHQQRPKTKKKERYRHKGKSSRGNGGERNHGNRKSLNKMPEPLNVRLQGNGDGVSLEGFGGKSNVVDILEYGIRGQDAKCGSSFLREALPTLHLPIGEAS